MQTANKENIEANHTITTTIINSTLPNTQNESCTLNEKKSDNIQGDHTKIDQIIEIPITPSKIVIEDQLSNNNKESLQEQFKKFKKSRHEKFKYNQYLKNIKVKDRSTKEFQDYLRDKFVETAKKYLGIPYAKKYFKPGDKNYDSPIFLDCCGLVRQVVYDLREEFGFTLARWNQGYQYDTLPIDVSFENLKPGDLIFCSGTYYNTSSRKQKHDMTHVEIYLGGSTGEQTIGARWNNGVVSVFDSYKFISKTYYNMKFHFRSIDTWLQGICKSFCNEHSWTDDRDLWVPDKYSVFAAEDNDPNEDDINSGPNEDSKEIEEIPKEKIVENTAKLSKLSSKIQNGKQLKVFVGKGNNDRLIKNYFTNEKYDLMDQKSGFSTKYDIKWVQTSLEIDYLSFKEGEQIVNHIPNITLLTTKSGIIQTLRDYELAHKDEALSIKMDDFMPPTFRLDILSDEILFLNYASEGIWITKPYHANQGKRITLVTDITSFKEKFIKTKKFYLGEYLTSELFGMAKAITQKLQDNEDKESTQQDEFNENFDSKTIIQKYIENPLLLGNRKFDIRCYMLIASTKPLFVVFHHGYIRLSLNEYSNNFSTKWDPITHLTNNSVQKKHPKYYDIKENSIWSMSQFEKHLINDQKISIEQIKAIYDRIKQILKYTIESCQSKLDSKLGYFELLGCDIMLDSNLKPYLLEINTNPALFKDTAVQAEVIPHVIKKTLDLVMEINEKSANLDELFKNPQKNLDLDTFEILYNQVHDEK